jgi:hypothetical protein
VLAWKLLTYTYAEKYSFTAWLNNNEEMIMLKKTIALIGLTAAMTLSAAANAATVSIAGTIDDATGALASLTPPGTAFVGELDWSGTLNDPSQVLLGGFCFTTDASGLPPTSGTCGALSAVPILPTGETTYDGTPAAPGSTFEQAGTTFDGTSGIINILTFSPTFNAFIPIALTFNADGTGSVFADAGALGTASGPLDWTITAVPVPAAAWLFGSALLGLAGIKRRKLAA